MRPTVSGWRRKPRRKVSKFFLVVYYKVLKQSDLIDGWIIAMQKMHVGDQWELYIPAEMGYGKWSQPGIPGGSTLIFEVELLGVA